MRCLVFLGWIGCTVASDAEVAALAEGDAVELARTSATALLGLVGDPLDESGEVAGVGSCVWDWSLVGPRDGADFDAALRFVDCGGAWTGPRGGTLDHDVHSGVLTGTVDEAGDDWHYALSGSRSATTRITTSGDGTVDVDGTWTLLSLEGTRRLLEPGPFEGDLLYDGLADGVWRLRWSIDDDDDASGTLTGPRGATCSVSGSRYAIELDCP